MMLYLSENAAATIMVSAALAFLAFIVWIGTRR